jgi:hypothetical protein
MQVDVAALLREQAPDLSILETEFCPSNNVVPCALTSRSPAGSHPLHPPHTVAAAKSVFSAARAMMQLPTQRRPADGDVNVDGECAGRVGHPCCKNLVGDCVYNFDVWTSVHIPRGCVFMSVRGLKA